jgi:hypothetical protein
MWEGILFGQEAKGRKTPPTKNSEHSFCNFWKDLDFQQLFSVTIYKLEKGGFFFSFSKK